MKDDLTNKDKMEEQKATYMEKLAIMQEPERIGKPLGWRIPMGIPSAEQRVYDLVISDILSKRFAKEIKRQKMDIGELARKLGGWFYNPNYDQQTFTDGTYNKIPINRLELWLSGKLMTLPSKDNLRILESNLTETPNEILTIYNFGNDRVQDWLLALGYLQGDSYVPTAKFNNSPRLKALRKKKAIEEKQRQKEAEKVLKEQEKAKKKVRETFLSKIKSLARGQWEEEEI